MTDNHLEEIEELGSVDGFRKVSTRNNFSRLLREAGFVDDEIDVRWGDDGHKTRMVYDGSSGEFHVETAQKTSRRAR